MGTRARHLVAVVAAVALLSAACGDDDDDPVAADTTVTTGEVDETTTTEAEEEPADDEGGEPLEVAATDFAFSGVPEELVGGSVELSFTNDGTVSHEFALVETDGTDLDTFLTDFKPVFEGGPFPDYAEGVAVAGEIEPGDTLETTFLVAEGEYALFCALTGVAADDEATTTTAAEGGPPEEEPSGPPHFELGMIQPVTVTAGDGDAELPETDGSIVAEDYGFTVDVEAGAQTVSFTNEGPGEVHHAVFFPFAEGIDEEEAATALEGFLASEDEGPPPPELDFEMADPPGDSGIFSAGGGHTFETTFESGRTYAVVCFLSDRAGGPPHVVAHGMQEIFTVE